MQVGFVFKSKQLRTQAQVFSAMSYLCFAEENYCSCPWDGCQIEFKAEFQMILQKADQLPAFFLGKYRLFGLAEGLNNLCAVILLLESKGGKLHDKMRKT